MNNAYSSLRQKHRSNNFRFALGMGTNFVDLDRQCIYMIQEYAEKMNDPTIPADKKPKKIRVMQMDGQTLITELAPELIEERMKDPEPDPKYAYVPSKHGK